MLELEPSRPGAELVSDLGGCEAASITSCREFRRGPPRLLEQTEPVRFGLRHAASLARCGLARKRIEIYAKNREISNTSPATPMTIGPPAFSLVQAALAAAGLAWLLACSSSGSEQAAASQDRGEPTAAPLASPRGPSSARAAVPEGSFSSGTEPGRFARDPELEPRLTRTALGRFEIDTELYPGAGAPPLLGVTRDRASELCGDRGGRLCSELEWERACKGPASVPFASGAELDPSCAASPGCGSGFGVWGLGSRREWTASDVPGRTETHAAVRGAPEAAAAELRRCARRDAEPPSSGTDIGFRCCYGAPNGARVVLPRLGTTFQKVDVPLGDLSRWLAADPATAELARGLAYFEDPAASQAVLARGKGDRQGFHLTTSPLAWNPAPGVELLVVAARSGDATSFVVVFDALGDGSRRVSSSFVMQNERGPVALAYNGYIRPRVHFSTCWGCSGETGKILYRDPDRSAILQP